MRYIFNSSHSQSFFLPLRKGVLAAKDHSNMAASKSCDPFPNCAWIMDSSIFDAG